MTDHDLDHDLADLLHDTTGRWQPDVDRLVAGGLARGRGRRARTRLAATSALVAASAAVVGGAAVLGPSGTTAQDPAGSGSPAASASPGSSPTLTGFGVEPAAMADVLASLLPPGEVTEPRVWQRDDGRVQSGQVLLDGALVVVRLVRREHLADLHDVVIKSEDVPGVPQRHRLVSVLRGGYEVQLNAYNAPAAEHAEPVRPDPVLTTAELQRIATDPVWLETAP